MGIDNDEIDISDESEDSPQAALSINEIILRQIKKIGDICSKELTGGYWQKKPIKVEGGVMFSEEYKEDLRLAYCNSVDFIIDLVYPIGDEKLNKAVDNLEAKKVIGPSEKLSEHRIIFREINKMFERENFFNRSQNVRSEERRVGKEC